MAEAIEHTRPNEIWIHTVNADCWCSYHDTDQDDPRFLTKYIRAEPCGCDCHAYLQPKFSKPIGVACKLCGPNHVPGLVPGSRRTFASWQCPKCKWRKTQALTCEQCHAWMETQDSEQVRLSRRIREMYGLLLLFTALISLAAGVAIGARLL